MGETKLYYVPPSDEVFEELKENAIKVWQTYDNKYGYVDEKLEIINSFLNIEGRFMSIVAMFDIFNQRKLSELLGEECKKEIRDRLVDGGLSWEYIVF